MSRTRLFRLFLMALAVTPALVAPAMAEDVTFSYHDGSGEGMFQDLEPGDAEAFRFDAEHPAILQRVRLWTRGSGDVEVHVWADNGGLQPDLARDLATPVTVAAAEGEPVEVDFVSSGVRIDPPGAFYVGIVHDGPEPGLVRSGTVL